MKSRFVWFAVLSVILLLTFRTVVYSVDSTNTALAEDRATLTNSFYGEDEISGAYRVLIKNGNYEEKKKQLMIFSGNYDNPRVKAMIVDLLVYSYDNEGFKENDQVQYYDDVIAEGLIKILGRTGAKESFSALIRIAFNNRNHRDATVKEAWKAIQEINWK